MDALNITVVLHWHFDHAWLKTYDQCIHPTTRTNGRWSNVENIAAEILHPVLTTIRHVSHAGGFPPATSFMEAGDHLSISAIKGAYEQLAGEASQKENGFILRCFNPFDLGPSGLATIKIVLQGSNGTFT
jgi:alpha-mannosidase